MEFLVIILFVSMIAFFVFMSLDWEFLIALSFAVFILSAVGVVIVAVESDAGRGTSTEQIAAFKEQGYSFYNKGGRLYAVKNQIFDLGPSTNVVKEIKVEN